MKHAVQIEGRFSNVAKRDVELAAIVARVGAKPRWGPLVALATDALGGTPGLTTEVRFDTPADQVDLYDVTVARLASNYLAGSRVSRHVCSHDEAAPAPCALAAETVA